MSYLKKSYCFKSIENGSVMRCFNGHIKKETAIKQGYSKIVLSIIDMSGKGRSESRIFFTPFSEMKSFN